MEKLQGSLLGLKINGIFVPCETSCDFNFETDLRPASPVDEGGWKSYIAGARSWSISLNAAMLIRMVGTGLPLVLNAFMTGQRIDVAFATRRTDMPNFIISGKVFVLNGGINAAMGSRALWNTTLTGDGKFKLDVNTNIAYVLSTGTYDSILTDTTGNLVGGYVSAQENMLPEFEDTIYVPPVVVTPPTSGTQPDTLVGKKVAIMGNSISNPNRGATNPDATQLYWGLLKKDFNWTTDVDAISGTTIVPFGTGDNFSADVRINGFANRGFKPDYIIIEGGTNDFGDGRVTIGSMADAESNVTGQASFYASLKYLYNHLHIAYPTAKIFHIEPLQRSDKGNPATMSGKLLADFVTAINVAANAYNVTVIHAFDNSGLTYANMVAGGSYTGDGLHPNVAGHAVLADFLKGILLSGINAGGGGTTPPNPDEVGKLYYGYSDTPVISYNQIIAGLRVIPITSRTEYIIPFSTSAYKYLWFAESVSLLTKSKYSDSANPFNNGTIGGSTNLFGTPTVISGAENLRLYVTNYKTLQSSTFKITT